MARRSTAADIDGHDTRFGSVQAARRVARTVFLGSAPSNAAQAVRGIRVEGILLGAAQPGQAVGTHEDVIKRLAIACITFTAKRTATGLTPAPTCAVRWRRARPTSRKSRMCCRS